jgi:hypothetical protein
VPFFVNEERVGTRHSCVHPREAVVEPDINYGYLGSKGTHAGKVMRRPK